jgi:hypothetical protein
MAQRFAAESVAEIIGPPQIVASREAECSRRRKQILNFDGQRARRRSKSSNAAIRSTKHLKSLGFYEFGAIKGFPRYAIGAARVS